MPQEHRLLPKPALHLLEGLCELFLGDFDARPDLFREEQALLQIWLRNDMEVDVIDMLKLQSLALSSSGTKLYQAESM